MDAFTACQLRYYVLGLDHDIFELFLNLSLLNKSSALEVKSPKDVK